LFGLPFFFDGRRGESREQHQPNQEKKSRAMGTLAANIVLFPGAESRVGTGELEDMQRA